MKKVFPPPVFKYRGFFINDEDLLTGWAPARKGAQTGISLAVWNKIYETILRLKGNMVTPGTWIFPDDAQIRLAGKRGLILTQHHAIPLGVNVARWPKGVPYSYTDHPEILEHAWKDAVAEYPPGVELLWTVGLRGLSDASYARFDPNVRGNNKKLGRVIGKAIADQMQIVRARHPNASFITSLWQEGARLVEQGDLSIPPEVGLVWADAGYGYLLDGGRVAAGQGAYYHVAMMNGRANQLTEMVTVDRIYSELGRYIKAGATNYLLLNTSDIRPVSMTTEAVMDLAWQGLPPGSSAESFYRRWSADEFGKKAAAKVAPIYKEYFAAPAYTTFHGRVREYGDQYYHTEARLLLLAYMIQDPLYSLPSQSPRWIVPRVFDFPPDPAGAEGRQRLNEIAAKQVQLCRQAQPRWDAVWSKALQAESAVLPERRPFYRAQVLAMIAINRDSNRMLWQTAQAIQQAIAGDQAAAHASAARALQAIDEIHKAESAAEYGKWKNWYRGDWLTNVNRTGGLLAIFSKYVENPLSPLPAPALWTGWEAYHHIMQY
ncbi:MAG: glycosyl hydrolase 115 family protein, partial [Bryobacteraceae bacterium]